MSVKIDKPRCFFVRTYLSEFQLNDLLRDKESQIRNCAYIYHDKDTDKNGELIEPHWHILFYCYCGHTLQQIIKWFNGFVDNKDMPINSYVEKVNLSTSWNVFDYLTHNTEKSIEQGKFVYDKDCIFGWNFDFFIHSDSAETDNLTCAITDLLCGVNLQTVVKRYGRDFIIHYSHIRSLLNDIKMEDINNVR